jgi:hypothetical protein
MTDAGLYEPTNTLKTVAPDIWIVDGPVVRMAAPFGTSAPFPTRMTIVRLRDGALWCHSPIAPDEGLFDRIDALGPVRHLVSHDPLHYAAIAALSRCARVGITGGSPARGIPGDRRRVRCRSSRCAAASLGGGHRPGAFPRQPRDRGIRVLPPRQRHRDPGGPDRNFEARKLTRGVRWIARLGGVLDPDGKTPLDMRMTFFGRKPVARQCFERIMAWHPRRAILAHGRWYPENAEAELRRAFRWLD